MSILRRCTNVAPVLQRASNVKYSLSDDKIPASLPQSFKKRLITSWHLPGIQGRYRDV